MNIFVPAGFEQEKNYAFNFIIPSCFRFNLIPDQNLTGKYLIVTDKNYRIVMPDNFFSRCSNGRSPYVSENLPGKVSFFSHDFFPEKNLPVFYGTGHVSVTEKEIYFDCDPAAVTLFMLSRWEELFFPEKDVHQRPCAAHSLAFRNNFLHRPVLDELSFSLENMLEFLGEQRFSEKKEANLILTHDIDSFCRWDSIYTLFRQLSADILKWKSFQKVSDTLKEYLLVLQKKQKDPFDTFSYLMDVSEKAGVRSIFFFKTGGTHQFDHPYQKDFRKMKKTMREILDRGHEIGLHPSYLSSDKPQLIRQEKEVLENLCRKTVTKSRQHFLRFIVPDTWADLENCGITADYSMGYHDCEGFRCGTSRSFHPFDIIRGNKISILEYPLLVMDGTLCDRHANLTAAFDSAKKIIQYSLKYKGNATILWHNSSFNTRKWNRFNQFYEGLAASAGISSL